jgi:hypothetical protein
VVGKASASDLGAGRQRRRTELVQLLDKLQAVYLDTGESRGLVADTHPSVVAAMRGAVLSDAGVVLTVGRRLDFQLAYGSPAVFGDARFVRIGNVPGELCDNRRGAVEICASPGAALRALIAAPGNRRAAVNGDWAAKLRSSHEERAAKLRNSIPRPTKARMGVCIQTSCSPPSRIGSTPRQSSSTTAAISSSSVASAWPPRPCSIRDPSVALVWACPMALPQAWRFRTERCWYHERWGIWLQRHRD